jgi:hypothetical protein
MKTVLKSIVVGLCALGPSASVMAGDAAGKPRDNLYTRVAAKMSADPALVDQLEQLNDKVATVAWLLGEWDVVAEVQAAARVTAPEHGTSKAILRLDGTVIEHRDSYPSGNQDLGFLSYSPATKIWTAIGLDALGNAIVTRGQPTADGMVFEGDVLIVGVATHLRQTIHREGDDAYVVTNEERDGETWQVLDTYRYTRKKPAAAQ